METEQEMITRECAKQDRKLRRMLARVTKTGFPSSGDVCTTLLVNNLIEFGSPSEAFAFNHYRLTPIAKHFLKTGKLVNPAEAGILEEPFGWEVAPDERNW
jgi:hypothetical protein